MSACKVSVNFLQTNAFPVGILPSTTKQRFPTRKQYGSELTFGSLGNGCISETVLQQEIDRFKATQREILHTLPDNPPLNRTHTETVQKLQNQNLTIRLAPPRINPRTEFVQHELRRSPPPNDTAKTANRQICNLLEEELTRQTPVSDNHNDLNPVVRQ